VSSLAVRVKLRARLKKTNKVAELVVLVNGGAESLRPCLVVDTSVAEALGVYEQCLLNPKCC